MAKTQKIKDFAKNVDEKSEENPQKKEDKTENLIRIMQTDISGNKCVYVGLTKIKGVGFGMSNAVSYILGIEKNKKIEELSQEEIDKISETIKNPPVPEFMKNRRKDFESGESKHLSITNLDLQKEFDLKRMKKIKSYKGNRHSRGLSVRGQRTKSHFRKKSKNKVVGVKGKKK